MDTKKKYEIEAALAKEAQAISAGQLKEENPLDLSDDFRVFCEACRRGDLKVCQEMISSGININARDKFDYTPLILVRHAFQLQFISFVASLKERADR
jgi:ankyrin repeat protein